MEKRVFSSLIALLTAVVLLLTVFTGCSPTDEDMSESSEYSDDESSQEESNTSRDDFAQRLEDLRANMPVIDGSTSTIPLEAGIRAALLDISLEEAEKQVSHSTTYGSFYNLVQGKCDVILTVPLSQVQYDNAASWGMELEKFPIAMEGFVFVVNADNPVDSLDAQQLKDIYSGKITNWKEVGGSDADIVPYQRNQTSGSQNYMLAFMGDTELPEPKTETLPATMSGLMDVISSYDNAINSIGYSVYSYAAEMYVAASNVKFIQVDGIAPSVSTMYDGSYPLLSYNYAVIDANTPENAPVRTLIEWIMSEEGQQAVSASGYIPVSEIASPLEAEIVMPLLSDGTGREKASGYVLPETYYGVCSSNYLKYDTDANYRGKNYRAEGLLDSALQKEINDFIDDAEANAELEKDKAKEYIFQQFDYDLYYGILVKSECENGYLSVVVSSTYEDGSQDSPFFYYSPVTAVWDLYTGERLSFTDMFWREQEFIATVNNGIRTEINQPYNSWGQVYDTTGDFWALTGTFDTFSLNNVYFASGEGIFPNGIEIDFSYCCEDMLVTSELRDMKGIWEDDSIVYRSYREYYHTDVGFGDYYEEYITFWQIDAEKSGMEKAVCDKINAYMLKKLDDNFSSEALKNRFGEKEYSYDWPPDVTFTVYGKSYVVYEGCFGVYIQEDNEYFPIYISTIFDYKTGDVLMLDDIFLEGWRDEVEQKYDIYLEDTVFISIGSMQNDYDVYIYLSCKKSDKNISVYVPSEYIIFK